MMRVRSILFGAWVAVGMASGAADVSAQPQTAINGNALQFIGVWTRLRRCRGETAAGRWISGNPIEDCSTPMRDFPRTIARAGAVAEVLRRAPVAAPERLCRDYRPEPLRGFPAVRNLLQGRPGGHQLRADETSSATYDDGRKHPPPPTCFSRDTLSAAGGRRSSSRPRTYVRSGRHRTITTTSPLGSKEGHRTLQAPETGADDGDHHARRLRLHDEAVFTYVHQWKRTTKPLVAGGNATRPSQERKCS